MAVDTTDPDNPHWYIVGFLLYADKCVGAPKMFTKVAPYMDWILEQTREYSTDYGSTTERGVLYATGGR